MNKLLACFCALFFLHCTEVPDYGTLKVNASPAAGGSVKKSPAGSEYKDGTVVTLTAEAKSGYEFAGWLGNVTEMDAKSATITIDGDNVVIANFVEIPKAPSITAITSSTSDITLEWSFVKNATGYNIYRCTSSSGDYVKIGTSTTNSYIDTKDLLPGASYYYKVTAYNGNIEGQLPSGYARETMQQLGAPTGLTATVNSATSITISWSLVPSAIRYYIYRSENFSSGYSQIDYSPTSSYTDTKDLSPGTSYYYKVTAYSNNGESPQSSAVSATTFYLNQPTNLKAESDEYCITISWLPVQNADIYRIYRSTSSSGSYKQIDDWYYEEYEDCPELAGTYYYKIEAYNSEGKSSPESKVVSARVTL